jgi:hypothetical protein
MGERMGELGDQDQQHLDLLKIGFYVISAMTAIGSSSR